MSDFDKSLIMARLSLKLLALWSTHGVQWWVSMEGDPRRGQPQTANRLLGGQDSSMREALQERRYQSCCYLLFTSCMNAAHIVGANSFREGNCDQHGCIFTLSLSLSPVFDIPWIEYKGAAVIGGQSDMRGLEVTSLLFADAFGLMHTGTPVCTQVVWCQVWGGVNGTPKYEVMVYFWKLAPFIWEGSVCGLSISGGQSVWWLQFCRH